VSPTPLAAVGSHKLGKFITIDEDGYFKLGDLRVADAESGHLWLSKMTTDAGGRSFTVIDGDPVLVEAFDAPYVALGVDRSPAWIINMPYGLKCEFQLETLTVDEWDRFHGRTVSGVPFVFSRAAQSMFFNLVDEFEDEAFYVDGRKFATAPWLTSNPSVNQRDWWSERYKNSEDRWDLGTASPLLPKLVSVIKPQKSRILVAGCGAGHDAAWWAQAGHIVTAIDFSHEAIARAQERYGHLSNLKFQQADVFQLPANTDGKFDLVFEHTLYCAIEPERRNELVKAWRRALADHGHLFGIFFTIDKPIGPPFGASEWELRARFGKAFRQLYWSRSHDSADSRWGQELFVYLQKRDQFSP
jgi:SAM-dependent methyltransferase